jgi:hypothetical protein
VPGTGPWRPETPRGAGRSDTISRRTLLMGTGPRPCWPVRCRGAPKGGSSSSYGSRSSEAVGAAGDAPVGPKPTLEPRCVRERGLPSSRTKVIGGPAGPPRACGALPCKKHQRDRVPQRPLPRAVTLRGHFPPSRPPSKRSTWSQVAGPQGHRADTMDHALEAGAQRVRDHLRRTNAGSREQLTWTPPLTSLLGQTRPSRWAVWSCSSVEHRASRQVEQRWADPRFSSSRCSSRWWR